MRASISSNTSRRPVHTIRGEGQRQGLVDAAYQLIAQGGFEHLRTRDVAARAGVNIATLHYYFASKEDLIRGVVERVHAELSNIPLAPAGEPAMPLAELRREFTDVVRQMRETPDMFVVLFELSLRAMRDPAIHRMLDEMDASWQTYVETYLAEGVRQGIFRADLDVPAAAATLVATIKGCIVQLAVLRRSFPLDRVSAEVEHWLTSAPR